MLALLSACSVKQDAGELIPVQTVAAREAALRAFKPWRASGSIAVDSETEGKFNASFAWEASLAGFDIKLFGPLGVQVIHLSEDKNGAQITDRNGSINGDDAQQLLTAALGATVPIVQMQDWAVGLPGDATEIERDKIGRLNSMVVTDDSNGKWNIDFKNYTVQENMYLPKTVLVEGPEVAISLSFKKWGRGVVVDSGRLSIPGVSS